MYIVIDSLFGRYKKFETKSDVIRYFWIDFHAGKSKNIRILDAYTHQCIDIAGFVAEFNCILHERRIENARRRYGKYEFRKDPIRGTGKRKRRWRGAMKYPRTKQELSQEIATRAKRRCLPTSWDDLWRDSERNWKSQRKTQYKMIDK